MSDRRAVRRMLVALTAAGLCVACGGHPEKRVVDQYFNAMNAQDNQTLASFAAVKFDKKVDNWKINDDSPETRTPAQLRPSWPRRSTRSSVALRDNKKAYNAYFLEHPKEVDQVRDLLKKDDRRYRPTSSPTPPSGRSSSRRRRS